MTDLQLPPPTGAQSLLNESDPEYKWLIPGILERGDRWILTGGEGKGKSTFLRQIAVQLSLGLHPFTHEDIGARSVLYIDLENSRRQTRRELRKITRGRVLSNEMLQICTWPAGIDLTLAPQQMAFTKIISEALPDVVIIGPTYKMAPHLETEEQSAYLTSFLDLQRTTFDFSLLMESHQPHQVVADGKRYRPERPFGSSLWLRWPEFGICLEDDGTLRPWRGARDAEREWPEKLYRGDEWPWEVDPRICVVCQTNLEGQQEKYCSDKCATTGRQRNLRARTRLH